MKPWRRALLPALLALGCVLVERVAAHVLAGREPLSDVLSAHYSSALLLVLALAARLTWLFLALPWLAAALVLGAALSLRRPGSARKDT